MSSGVRGCWTIPATSTRTTEGLPLDLVSIVLDHRVREKFAAHAIDGLTCRGLAAGRQLDLDELALAHRLDPLDPERPHSVLDGLALWVENAVLQGDDDACFH